MSLILAVPVASVSVPIDLTTVHAPSRLLKKWCDHIDDESDLLQNPPTLAPVSNVNYPFIDFRIIMIDHHSSTLNGSVELGKQILHANVAFQLLPLLPLQGFLASS